MPKGASSAGARQRPGAVTFARLTPYLRGIIYGLRMADYGVLDIIQEVEKADGAPPSRSAVLRSLALSDRIGGLVWDGVVPSAGGRPKTEWCLRQVVARRKRPMRWKVTTMGHRQVAA